MEVVGGSFRGHITWTLDLVDGGTRLGVRFVGEAASWPLRLLSPIVDVGAEHSRGLALAVAGLRRHLDASSLPTP